MSNTTFLQEPEPLDREQSVEAYIKLRLQSLDRAVAGSTEVSLQGLTGNVDLSPTQAKHRSIKLTGAPAGAVTLRIPHATGANADPIFTNACTGSSSTVTVKSTGANAGNSSGVPVSTGETAHVRHDGESAYRVTPAGILAAPEVSVTGATTLASSAFGRAHACAGTTADYTVTLPTPTAADVGREIEVRMNNALTKFVTIDAGATRSIDGQQTRVMWAGEVARLRCVGTSGVCWVKVSGKTRLMSGMMYLSANQSIPSGGASPTQVTLNASGVDVGGMVDTANSRFNIKRPGTYEVTGQAWFNSVAVAVGLLDFYKGGAQIYETYGFSPSVANNLVMKGTTIETCAAGDQLDLRVFQNAGSSQSCIGHATVRYTNMSVTEKLGW